MSDTLSHASTAIRRRPVDASSLNGPGGSPTQSLDRALELLDVVVGHTATGISLGSLAAIVGLSKPTAHRLLSGLRSAGMIDYEPGSRRYHPAFKLYSMGQAASGRFDVIHLAAASLERLAEDTADSVFLTARSGDFAVCVARRSGGFPIKASIGDIGDVRPLGLGADGLVLLAALPDSEVERNLERHREAIAATPRCGADEIRRQVSVVRELGHGFAEAAGSAEISALAVGIRGANQQVEATISVVAIASRLTQPRRSSVLQQVLMEVEAVERLMRDRADSRRAA
ncbi:IclR family transcriptional regulator [Xylophilus sp. GOD-11R]|uniref:IclR family transcriptional regulator n=1 Tax=Xylophilus sp. GOD-11R TaxID=3089814 RepID=UPI00298D22E3|nr:IclR family transcriptional regulator [Xylophilus sp. GOD-11R]WPB59333.1 IclR family transcriptional regulator [Xylophilus sp. GOD-11R]